MSDVEWDAEDFEPPAAVPAKPTDKWDGEDEDDSVKDNWDDEDEESEGKEKEDKPAGTDDPTKKKKRKKLADIIAEKEAKQVELMEQRRKEAAERENASTPEEKLAEKLRLQKVQEDSDLQLANELMGTVPAEEEKEVTQLDGLDVSTVAGLTSFRKAILSKIRSTERLERRPFYVNFVEELSRELCQNIDLEDVKKITTVLNSLYNDKVKANKPKNKKKGGGKAKLNVGQGAITDDVANDFGGFNNEYDDFI